MSGGLLVVAGVVGALALFETILPWTFAALRRWRRARTRAKEAKNEATDRRTVVASATGTVTDGLNESPTEGRPDGVAKSGASPEKDSMRAADPLAGACRDDRDPGRSEAEKAEDRTDLAVPSRGDRDGTVDANRLWEEAREMPHRFIPDPMKDGDYLSKVYDAAKLGHLEAMVKLGDYAYRRGAVVEAYYWTTLAELKGAVGLVVALREMRKRWLAEGCPEEYGNTYTDFTEEQGVFARAVLRLQCGVNPQYARARLKELAERGVEEARLFLGKGNVSAK